MKNASYCKFSAALVITFLILFAAACSKEEKPASSVQTAAPPAPAVEAKRLDPCTLVSKEEVRDVVGVEVGDPKPNTTNKAVCDYKFGDFNSVSFMVPSSSSMTTPDQIMDGLKKQNIPVTETSGVGDRAFFADPGYGMVQLNAFKGNQYVILTMTMNRADEAKKKSIAAELMKKALSKF